MESVEAREGFEDEAEQLEMFEGVPVSRRSYALRSGELGTEHHLAPGQIVRGRFAGQVAGIHHDRKTKKDPSGNDIPVWGRKVIVEVISAELDVDEAS